MNWYIAFDFYTLSTVLLGFSYSIWRQKMFFQIKQKASYTLLEAALHPVFIIRAWPGGVSWRLTVNESAQIILTCLLWPISVIGNLAAIVIFFLVIPFLLFHNPERAEGK